MPNLEESHFREAQGRKNRFPCFLFSPSSHWPGMTDNYSRWGHLALSTCSGRQIAHPSMCPSIHVWKQRSSSAQLGLSERHDFSFGHSQPGGRARAPSVMTAVLCFRKRITRKLSQVYKVVFGYKQNRDRMWVLYKSLAGWDYKLGKDGTINNAGPVG